jgi:DNA mismatch endonuclease (patch repair protein)
MAQSEASESGRRRKAGHRAWAPRNQPVPGRHEGDTMAPETRSRVMARIKGRNTGPELTMFRELAGLDISFERHAKDLPGSPDIVLRDSQVAVFVDGDFWHGWRFPLWKHKLSEQWREKIQATRARDQRHFRKLRKMGWKVIRLWEHQIVSDPQECARRITEARRARL